MNCWEKLLDCAKFRQALEPMFQGSVVDGSDENLRDESEETNHRQPCIRWFGSMFIVQRYSSVPSREVVFDCCLPILFINSSWSSSFWPSVFSSHHRQRFFQLALSVVERLLRW